MRSFLRKQGNHSRAYKEFTFAINVFMASLRYITLNKDLLPKSKALQALNVY